MKSDNDYENVYITLHLTSEVNQLLSEACERSGRKKIPEAFIRLYDHLLKFRSISELNHAIPNQINNELIEMDVDHVCTSNQ